MVHPYFWRITYWLKKKRRKGCPETKLGNRHLVVIGEKDEVWPHFTYWAYSGQLLQLLRLKKKKNSMMMHFLRELFAKTLTLCTLLTLCTVVYKRLRKCGSCHNVSRNMKSCVAHQTYCCSLKWPKLNLYPSSYVFGINQVN